MPDTTLYISGNTKKIIAIISIIFIWVLLSGIGGFCWQNRWDHIFRNAIFNDLVFSDWPVRGHNGDNPVILCYFIGYWLPSALLGKLFSSVAFGYAFQLFWGFVGVVLAFFLVSEWLKKISYKALIVFIFFSGLDILIYIFKNPDLNFLLSDVIKTPHIEFLLGFFNSSSNTTLLFWLYNQIIPFWIGFMLILLQKDRKYLFFTYSLLILFAPFPTLALAPAIMYLELKNYKIEINAITNTIAKSVWQFVKCYITIPNVVGFIILISIALFYKSNLATNKLKVIPLTLDIMISYIVFLCLEFGIFILFIYKRVKKDYLFYVILSTMMVFSFCQLGNNSDFAWRTAIPSAFYVMLIVIKEIVEGQWHSNFKYKLLVAVLVVASINPCIEILRTLKHTIGYKKYNQPFLSGGLQSVFQHSDHYDNFVGKSDSFFYKYLMK